MNQAPEPAQVPAPKSDWDGYIKIKLVNQDMTEVHFKVKLRTLMIKVKKSYAGRMGMPVNTLRFLFDGRRVHDDDTPEQLYMLEDDVIEVFQEQTGGY